MKNRTFIAIAFAIASIPLLAGCGDDSGETSAKGSVQVFVEAEDTIPNGLTAGMGNENVKDGWNVTYDRFLVAIGNVRAARGHATLCRGQRTPVLLEEVAVDERGPILRRYLDLAPGARPHLPVSRHAPLDAFAAIAGRYPVFRIVEVPEATEAGDVISATEDH